MAARKRLGGALFRRGKDAAKEPGTRSEGSSDDQARGRDKKGYGLRFSEKLEHGVLLGTRGS